MEHHSNLITEKLEQLIELSKVENEVNVQIIIHSLLGAREMGCDGILAAKVQEYLKDVLIPMANRGIEEKKASLN